MGGSGAGSSLWSSPEPGKLASSIFFPRPHGRVAEPWSSPFLIDTQTFLRSLGEKGKKKEKKLGRERSKEETCVGEVRKKQEKTLCLHCPTVGPTIACHSFSSAAYIQSLWRPFSQFLYPFPLFSPSREFRQQQGEFCPRKHFFLRIRYKERW